MDESTYWAAFASVPGLTLERLNELSAHFGDMRDAWRADTGELQQAGLQSKLAGAVEDHRKRLDIDDMMDELDLHDVQIVTANSAQYPKLLLEVFDPPPVLYVKGELKPKDGEGVAVVGTRRSTRYGELMCDRIAGGIASAGVTIISGLARGIDTGAHRAAVNSGGRTVAVLGGGIGRIYPPENRGLAEEITANGCIVSEYPFSARPHQTHFPMRNRIIVGLARGIVVVEAPHRSGIQRTVKWALESNREVFAVPGEIGSDMSRGCNRFLKQGATVATSARDVITSLQLHYPEAYAKLDQIKDATPNAESNVGNMTGRTSSQTNRQPKRSPRDGADPEPSADEPFDESVLQQLEGDESAVSRFLADSGTAHCVDEIARGSHLPAHTVATALTTLQVKSIVTCLEGTMYSLVGGSNRRLLAA